MTPAQTKPAAPSVADAKMDDLYEAAKFALEVAQFYDRRESPKPDMISSGTDLDDAELSVVNNSQKVMNRYLTTILKETPI